MATQLVTYSQGVGSGTQNINIPSTARDIYMTVRSASGGRGGNDANGNGGSGGPGRQGTFLLTQNFVARTLTVTVGGQGGNASSGSSPANGGAAGAGVPAGGVGGGPGPRGWSGGGGGGGGGSLVSQGGTNLICVGGGGGGGGGSWNTGQAPNGGAGAGPGASGPFGVSNGGGGVRANPDGGGGGGGGGGAAGGGGGYPGIDKNRGGGPGGGGGSRYYSSLVSRVDGVNDNFYGNGTFALQYTIVTPEISEFDAAPTTVTSTNGGPKYNSTLVWTTADAVTVRLYKGGSNFDLNMSNATLIGSTAGEGVTTIGFSGTFNINDLPQSVVETNNSPSQRYYYLQATTGTNVIVEDVLIEAYNDTTPTTVTVNDVTNLEPGPGNLVEVNTTAVGGIDIPTSVTCSAGLFVKVGASWTTQTLVSNGEILNFRFDAPPFNTDENGLTNTQTFTYTIGTRSFSFNATTRAPNVEELFDFGDLKDAVPFPAPNYTGPATDSKEYLVSPTIVEEIADNWNIELEYPYGVQIKSDNEDLEVNVKNITETQFDPNGWENPNLMD